MKRSTEIISGIATQVFLTALLVWIFCFTKVNHPFTVMEIRYPFLCAACVFAYLADYALVQKGIRLSVYLIIQMVITAAGVFLCIHSIRLEPKTISTMVFMCVLFAVMLLVGAFIAYERVQESGMLIRFDLSAFMIIILLLLEKWLEFPARTPALVMCLVSLGVSLAAIIARRVGRFGLRQDHVQGNRHIGRIFLLVSLGIVCALTALIYFLASDSLETAAGGVVRILTAALNAVKTAAVYLYRLFERFITWLASLFPAEEMTMDMQALPAGGMESGLSIEGEVQVPIWFYVVLGAVIAGILAFLLFRLRKYRMKKAGRTSRTQSLNIVRESHLKASLKQLFSHFAQRLRFRMDAFRYRNTIPGVLLWCERHVPADRSRRVKESAQAFLRRLAEEKSAEESKDPLLCLAELTERCFYADRKTGGDALDPVLIRSVKKAMKNS